MGLLNGSELSFGVHCLAALNEVYSSERLCDSESDVLQCIAAKLRFSLCLSVYLSP